MASLAFNNKAPLRQPRRAGISVAMSPKSDPNNGIYHSR